MLGTALQESQLRYKHQFNGGPGLGYFQMERDDHNDIWTNFLAYRQQLQAKVIALLDPGQKANRLDALLNNDRYAAAMCRVHYYRYEKKEQLPSANDIMGMARYWKNYYNTSRGGGTEDEFVLNWNRLTLPPPTTN